MELFVNCPKCGTKIDLGKRIEQLVAERSQTAAAEMIKGMKRKMEEDKKKATELAAAQARKEAEEKAARQREYDKRERQKLEAKLKQSQEARRKERAEMERKLRPKLEREYKLRRQEDRRAEERRHKERVMQLQLEVAEKDKQRSEAQRRVQELERRLAQGSEQKRGIIAEEGLYSFLDRALPPGICQVEKRGQGKKGTDAIIRVLKGKDSVGCIIVDDKWSWTGDWHASWVEKAWKDMQVHSAQFAYIVANPSAFPKSAEELRSSGFGPAPTKKPGIRVWVVDGSNPALVAAVLRDTVEKLQKMAEIEAVHGAGSTALKKFKSYLTSRYHVDLREKARRMSAAVKGLHGIRGKVDDVMESLRGYWITEKDMHEAVASCFGRDSVEPLPQLTFSRE